MKHICSITAKSIVGLFFIGFLVMGYTQNSQGETLEYSVISIDAKLWIVTAKEIATGDIVKFRLPPAVFKGQTFDASLSQVQKGQSFSAKGQSNAQLRNLSMVESKQSKTLKKQAARKLKVKQAALPAGRSLGWEIQNVDASNWIVTAKNRGNRQEIKFKVDPSGFAGFQFKADLDDIGQGQGFSMVTPNSQEFRNMCTLIEM